MKYFDHIVTKHAGTIFVALALVAGLGIWLRTSHDKQVLSEHNATAVPAPSQELSVDLSSASIEATCSTKSCVLHALITDKWVLLNLGSPRFSACSERLQHFTYKNVHSYDFDRWYRWSKKNELASRPPMAVAVHVPKFKSQPEAVAVCEGTHYDEASQTLKLGGRTIAILSPIQPHAATF